MKSSVTATDRLNPVSDVVSDLARMNAVMSG